MNKIVSGEVKKIADEAAERARAHGGFAIGTLKEFSQQTRFQEQPVEYPRARPMERILWLYSLPYDPLYPV